MRVLNVSFVVVKFVVCCYINIYREAGKKITNNLITIQDRYENESVHDVMNNSVDSVGAK
jgi:hypothetical protein